MMQGCWGFFPAPAELREGGNVAGGAGTAGDMEEITMIKHTTSFEVIYINCRFTLYDLQVTDVYASGLKLG